MHTTVVFPNPVKANDALDAYPSVYDAIDAARNTKRFFNDITQVLDFAKVRENCSKSYFVNLGAEVARAYHEPVFAGARIGLHEWLRITDLLHKSNGHVTDPETGEILYPEYRGLALL